MPESASSAPSLSCLCLPARSTSAGRRTSFCRMSRPPDCAPQPDAPPFALSALRSSRPARLTPPLPRPRPLLSPIAEPPAPRPGASFMREHRGPSPLASPASRAQPLLASAPAMRPAIPPAGRALLHPSASPLPFSLPSAWCRCRLRLPHGTKRIKKQEPSAMPPHHERPLLRPYSELRKARFPAQKRADKILSIPCKVYQECHAD